MFSGNYFSYGDVNSEQYELMIAIINEEENKRIGGNLEYANFFNNDGKCEVMHSRYPGEVFSFDMELCRVNGRPIEYAEHQSICRDFFNSPAFKKMQILDGEYSGLYFYAYITDVEKIVASVGVVGYKGTVVCNSAYMWDDKKYTCSINGKEKTLSFYNHTLLPFYTNVDMKLVTGNTGGNCSIKRTSDNGRACLVELNGVPANTAVALTYNPKAITCADALYQKEVCKDNNKWNKKWLTFLQGNNELSFKGDISTVTLSYQSAKAVF